MNLDKQIELMEELVERLPLPVTTRRWAVRWYARPAGEFWRWLWTLGVHFDPKHPMLSIHLPMGELHAGRFYFVNDCWCMNDPNEWREYQGV